MRVAQCAASGAEQRRADRASDEHRIGAAGSNAGAHREFGG